MKTKSLVKQFCASNIKLVLSMSFFSIFSIASMALMPFISDKLLEKIQDILICKAKNSQTPNQEYLLKITDDKKWLVALTIALAFLVVCLLVFSALKDSRIRKFGNKLSIDIENKTYSSVINSEIGEIEKYSKEDLRNRIIMNSKTIGIDYYGKHLLPLIYSLVGAIVMVAICFYFDVKSGLVSLVCAPVLYFIVASIDKIINKKNADQNDYLNKLDESFDYTYDNIKNIKIRNGLKKEADDFSDLSEENFKNYNSLNTYKNLNNKIVPFFVISAAVITIFGFVAYSFYYTEELSLGKAVGMVLATSLYFMFLKNVIKLYLDNIKVDEAHASVSELLELKQENRSDTITSLEDIYSLKFSNVCFSVDNENTLNDINFELKAGEKLGILCYDSQYKSVIADLTTKIIRPTSGAITINNCDILKINTYYLRELVSYVPQTFNLLNASVEANIIYPFDLDEYKYNDALNKCILKEKVFSLNDLDQTNIISACFDDSCKQKVALANAMYKDSPIIILDESTNKLDEGTEKQILGEFLKMKNKIVILSSSRINVASMCDQILVIANGKVMEYGKTEDILNNNKSFVYGMFNKPKKGAM